MPQWCEKLSVAVNTAMQGVVEAYIFVLTEEP